MSSPVVTPFFHSASHTWTYVVTDPASGKAAVIDPVRDFNAASGRTDTESAEVILDHLQQHDLQLAWVLETHAHADHLSAAPIFREQACARLGIGVGITLVQQYFAELFGFPDLDTDGSQFDQLFDDGDEFALGELTVRVIATPGHTPACVSFLIGDAVFVGDTVFMPDFGSARCDFPGGDAATLYRSIQKLYELPDDTRMFHGHDYLPRGRDEFQSESSVAAQKARNIHVNQGVSEAEFVAMRTERDATLAVPALLLPALQVNIRAGALPEPAANGTRYLQVPLNRFN